ncbi:MAG TPA: phosphatidate cytidylyltransferase [Bacteroidota bacterium]|nr:phosphatidate cytidylyltransferase [Bacteroidota bacterium]
MTKRILTAVVAIPIIIAICMAGDLYFFLFVAAASALALHEFYGLAKAKGGNPQATLGIFVGFLVNLSFYHLKLQAFIVGAFLKSGVAIPYPSQTQLLFMIIILGSCLIGIVELFRDKGSAITNVSTTLFGILYVSLFFGTFVGLRELFTSQDPVVYRLFVTQLGISDPDRIYRFGGFMVISLFAMIWICDSAAFHAGTAMGKHKLFPRVSPNKSWEGAIFGFIFAIAAACAAKYLVLDFLPLGAAIIVGIIVGTIGQIGDLFESLLKRDAGVKDSGTLIPGHGGALDRFDSLLLVAPLVYYYIDYVFFS